MYYIFIVNNFMLREKELSGKEVVDHLLNKKHWLFHHSTPNIKKIRPQDKALVYVAGKNNRYFYANFKITGEITDNTLTPSDKTEEELYSFFPLSCPIEVLNIWEPPLMIVDIKDELSFITDKKNYGLFFRQSTKVIGEKDYNLISKRG